MNVRNKWLLGVVSAGLIGAAALWEGGVDGEVSKPYKDIGGVVTVCYGYTGKDIEDRPYSKTECEKLLRNELREHAEGVLGCIKQPLNINQYEAFTLMAYNVGVNGFCNSRAVRLFNQGYSKEACRAMAYGPEGKPAWSYVKGKYVRGLHNRRIYEMNKCLSPIN